MVAGISSTSATSLPTADLLRRKSGRQISQYSLRRMAQRLQQESILDWSKSKLKRAFDHSRAALQSFKKEQHDRHAKLITKK
jgi:hypothetical protein